MSNNKTWYLCPNCGKKIALYKDNAESKKVYLICRGCKQEIEILIKNKVD